MKKALTLVTALSVGLGACGHAPTQLNNNDKHVKAKQQKVQLYFNNQLDQVTDEEYMDTKEVTKKMVTEYSGVENIGYFPFEFHEDATVETTFAKLLPKEYETFSKSQRLAYFQEKGLWQEGFFLVAVAPSTAKEMGDISLMLEKYNKVYPLLAQTQAVTTARPVIINEICMDAEDGGVSECSYSETVDALQEGKDAYKSYIFKEDLLKLSKTQALDIYIVTSLAEGMIQGNDHLLSSYVNLASLRMASSLATTNVGAVYNRNNKEFVDTYDEFLEIGDMKYFLDLAKEHGVQPKHVEIPTLKGNEKFTFLDGKEKTFNSESKKMLSALFLDVCKKLDPDAVRKTLIFYNHYASEMNALKRSQYDFIQASNDFAVVASVFARVSYLEVFEEAGFTVLPESRSRVANLLNRFKDFAQGYTEDSYWDLQQIILEVLRTK